MENPEKFIKTLLIIDMQNDFSPEGALPIENFHKIIPGINSLMPQVNLVIATQDWHTTDHISFYTGSKNSKPFNSYFINENNQQLWPIHCVAETWGAELDSKLNKQFIHQIFRKGISRSTDAYSAFHLNDGVSKTGLEKFLDPNLIELYVCGVATSICVFNTVKSASKLGYRTSVIRDLCAGLSSKSEEKAFKLMEDFPNVQVINSQMLDHRYGKSQLYF